MRTSYRPALFLLLATVVSGCHGGSSPALMPALSPAQSQTGTASFALSVASPGAPNVAQSVVITLTQVNGAAPSVKVPPLVMNLSVHTPGCNAAAGGGLSCTATVTAPSGNDTFTVAMYASQNGTGAQLSSSQANAAITGAGKTACVPTSSDLSTLRAAH